MKHSQIASPRQADMVLTICPPWDISAPPLGLAYLATFLKSRGLTPHVVDLNNLIYTTTDEKLRDKLWKFDSFTQWEQHGCDMLGKRLDYAIQQCLEALLKVDAPVYGFSLYHANVGMSATIGRRIKEARPGATVVLGGPSCSDPFDRSDIPPGSCDYVISGEGEAVLPAFLRQIADGGDPTSIVGVSQPDTPLDCKDKSLVSDIDTLPFPTYEEFDLTQYVNSGQIRVVASRGCIARCRFCNENYYTGKYRYRSAQKVFEELMHHRNRYGIRAFIFSDQEVNGHLPQLETLCELLVQEDAGIEWSGQAIARRDMSYALFCKMRQAGCKSLDFGIESGSPSVLTRMGKPFSAQQAAGVLRRSRKADVATCINLIVGFPGETEDELLETMAFLKENRENILKVANISTCFIKPFSDFHFNASNYGIHIPQQPYFWYRWEDLGASNNRTNAQRIEKLHRMVECCHQLGIHVDNTYCFQ